MRPYILAESNWKYIEKAKFDLAILPWGATEAHNYHMPYGTDVIEADEIAAESAKKAWDKGGKVIVLPTIPFGVNTGQMNINLDMNIYPSTQKAILKDILEVLNNHNIRRLLILNSHGGNDFKTMIRELGVQFSDMFICACNWYQSLDKTKYFEEAGDHADEMETSLIMHLRNDLLLPLADAGNGHAKKWKVDGLNESWAWAERKWSQVTKDTGVGNPKKASKEKGKRFFDDVTEKVGTLMYDLSKSDINDLYA